MKTNPSDTCVRYIQCSCGLTETITIWHDAPILTSAFREKHAGHTLTGIGLLEPEHITLGSMWTEQQAHYQAKAQPGRRR